MINQELYEIALKTLDSFRRSGRMIATAESCTGGLIAAALTAVPGSSDIVDRGFITYTNQAKTEMLGVDADLITRYGAVSEPVAKAMAEGALSRSHANVAVAVTGVAGPGESERKPAGLVYIGCSIKGLETVVEVHRFAGDRAEVRRATVIAALSLAVSRAC